MGAPLPFRAGSFDHVLIIGTFGALPDHAGTLAEVRRVLRKGGRLSVSEQMPDPDFMTKPRLRTELRAAGFRENTTRGWLWYTTTWS